MWAGTDTRACGVELRNAREKVDPDVGKKKRKKKKSSTVPGRDQHGRIDGHEFERHPVGPAKAVLRDVLSTRAGPTDAAGVVFLEHVLRLKRREFEFCFGKKSELVTCSKSKHQSISDKHGH